MCYLLILIAALVVMPVGAKAQSRTLLPTPATWYVDNVGGNDANACTAAAPCRTIQHTINDLVGRYDFAAQPTIQLVTTGAAYDEAVVLPRWVGSLGWYGPGDYRYPVIQGDVSNRAAVTVRPSSGWAFTSVNGSPWILSSLTIEAPQGGGINSDAYSHILGRDLRFGQVSGDELNCQVLAQHGALYEHIGGPPAISGGGWCHAYAHLGGMIKLQGPGTVVISNAPYFVWFAVADGNAILDYSGVSWSGPLRNGQYRPVHTSTGGLMFPTPATPPWP